jgi:hypothetical protein
MLRVTSLTFRLLSFPVIFVNDDCLQRICDKIYGMHKIHGNYGRVFSEWSAIEKEMADGLQSAGHYMDV